ncbi:MAG TPA: choice-of-anchor tandem repeat GloVer-containing protein [Cyclobacteriaceae bacterium]|nr:choice-of-anchor tandem repeat GloVer-containing protein [Cyclobacteriaceae bacterium]
MKRTLLTVVLAVVLSLLVIVAIAQNNTWTAKEDFGGGKRSLAAAFSAGTKIYAGTGLDDIGNLYDDVWEYDITNDSWTQKGSFDGGVRFGAISFTLNGKGYIAFGADFSGGRFNDVWEYNDTNDTWTRKADFPDGGRAGQFVFVVDNKAYVGSGQNAIGGLENDLWVFDPIANTWTEKASLPGVTRTYAVAFAIGTKGYVGTGADVNQDDLSDFWEYNTQNNQWTRKADYPTPTFGSIGFATATRGYVGLGSNNDLYSYYPNENVWVQQADFTDAFVYVTGLAVLNGGKAYVGLGQGSNTPGFFTYTPGTEQAITFNALTAKTFGDAAFGLTASASSGLTVSFTSSNTSVATISGSTVTIVGGGTTTIRATQPGNGTYDAAPPVERTLTINKANQTITFGALPGKNVNDAQFALTATASSTLPVSYASSNPTVATVSGSTVTILGSGTTTITASQSGNTNYNAATSVDQDLVVSKLAQTITFAALSAKVGGDAPFNLTATASSTLAVSYSSSNTSVATISGSTVTIVGAGTTTITASQTGNVLFNAATSVGRDLVVTKGSQTWVGSLPTTTGIGGDLTLTLYLSSNLPYTLTSSDESVATVSSDGTDFKVSAKAFGTTTLTASHPGNAMYNAAPTITSDMVVSKAIQTITFEDVPEKTFLDGNVLFIATSSSGLPVTFEPTDINAGVQVIGNVGLVYKPFDGDIVAKVEGTDYYLPATVTKRVVVKKLDVAMVMEPIPDKTVDDAPFTPTVTSEKAIVAPKFTSSNTAVATVAGSLITIVGKGTTTIQASIVDAAYSSAPSSQILTVKDNQAITFNDLPTKKFGDPPFTLEATSSAGLPITYSTGDPNVATVSGNTITITGVGSTSIIATAGNNQYITTSALQSLVVKNVSQTSGQQGQLWGVIPYGGEDQQGYIIRTNSDGTGLRIVKDFSSASDDLGNTPFTTPVIGSNGKIYLSTSRGCANGYGCFFEYDPSSGATTRIFDYEYSDFPIRSFKATANGKIYGIKTGVMDEVTGFAGPYVFELDVATRTITSKATMVTLMKYPTDLIVTAAGKIFASGFAGSDPEARLFIEFDPATATVTKRAELAASQGPTTIAGLVEVNGKIYGTNSAGGTNNQGFIFEFDPVANTTALKASMPAPSFDYTHTKGLMKTSSGRIFGLTTYSGPSNTGTIFEYDVALNTITTRTTFTRASGVPLGQMLEGTNGKLYAAENAGIGGGIFEYNPVTNELREIFLFDNNTGKNVTESLALSGNKLIGLGSRGGSNGQGVLFEFDYTTRQISKKLEFGDALNDGYNPTDGMVLHGNGKMYGVTSNGGANGDGTIFEVDPVTEDFKKVFDFNRNTSGSNPYGTVMVGLNGKLYGATRPGEGGIAGNGSFYEFDISTGAFKTLAIMNPTDGVSVNHQLTQAGNGKIYALTMFGGLNQKGSLVEIDVAGRRYRKLADATEFRGYSAYASPTVASNGKIYGTMADGGENGEGTLFEFDLTSNTYTVKHSFTASTGSKPYSTLVEIDGKLWGMASGGGSSVFGVLFSYDLASGTYEVKADLKDIGAAPGGKVLYAANGNLYFITTTGGRHAYGVIAEYDIAANKITAKVELPFNIDQDRNVLFLTQTTKSTRKAQTITINPIDAKVVGGAAFAATASATSGLPVVFTAGNDKITLDTETGKFSLTKAGKAIVKANQSGDASYTAAPEAQLTFCVNPAKPLIGYTINTAGVSTLTSSASSGNQWYKDGAAINGATSVGLTVDAPGVYSVISTVEECASVSSDPFPLVVTGDVDVTVKSFSVYPNPTDDKLYVMLPGSNRKKITLLQTDGRIAAEHETSSSVLEVDVRNYASGLYLVRISDENGTHPTLKFIRK